MRHGMLQAGMSRADVLALVAGSVVVGCLGVSMTLADPSGRGERLVESLANLRAIGSAMEQYRGDNRGHLPFEGVTATRRMQGGLGFQGVCGWQFGGRNNSAYWYSYAGGVFDVEAADRPLNPYLYPTYTFEAPVPPARLPRDAASRQLQQARVFRDPADVNGHSRLWSQPNTPVISSYEDVGTSYLFNTAWLLQFNPGGFVSPDDITRFNSLIASGTGVDPSRFVYVHDDPADVVLNVRNRGFALEGNHGGTNTGVALFADGHAAKLAFRPGAVASTSITPEYAVWFEFGLRGASGRNPAIAPRD